MKVDVERFGYVNLLQDLKFMISVVKILMDIDEIAREKKLCIDRRTVDIRLTLSPYLSIYLSLSHSLSLSLYIYIYI